MSVTSASFLGFAIGVAVLHALWGNSAWRQALMLVSNLAFVFSFTTSATALAPYAAFLILAYVSVRSAQFTRGPFPTLVFIAGTTFLFLWLKKYWFISAAVDFLPFAYFTVGLSYVFFRVMGLIIDAREDENLARVGPVEFFNFAMNFPTLIAGPIDRFQNFLKPPLLVTMPDVGASLFRIVQGFFKVVVVSYFFGALQEQGARFLLNEPAFGARLLDGILAIGSYPLQLYFNSSGYADIVIAIGVLFGKRYPENFSRPFLAFSFIEFWSRYHMSLSFWLRDYIYTPLLTAMMRKVPNPAFDPYVGAVSYFVTFFLIGLWHGSTIAFAIYGLLLGIGVSINKLHQVYLSKFLGRKAYRELSGKYLYRSAARGLTYAYFAFCLIFFWADIAAVAQVFERLGIVGMAACTATILVLAAMSADVVERILLITDAADERISPYAKSLVASFLVLACFGVVLVTANVDAKIIYQAF